MSAARAMRCNSGSKLSPSPPLSVIQSTNRMPRDDWMSPTAPWGRRRPSLNASPKSTRLRMVRSSVSSALISMLTVSVWPPKAASRVSRSRTASPPEGRKSRLLNSVSMFRDATPSRIVTTATASRKGAGRRANWPPRASTAGPTPGIAPDTGRGKARGPRRSRQRSSRALEDANSVNITVRPKATPTPATTPKSTLAGMGDVRLVRNETMVVTAARVSGISTERRPRRTATRTSWPSISLLPVYRHRLDGVIHHQPNQHYGNHGGQGVGSAD